MMPSIYELTALAMKADGIGLACSLVIAGVWSLIILGLAKAIFAGYPGHRARRWLAARYPELVEDERITWCLKSGHRWDIRMHVTPAFFVPAPLSDQDVSDLRARAKELSHTLRFAHAAGWLLDCGFCQCFWLAFVVAMLGGQDAVNAFYSCLIYGVSGSALAGWRPWRRKSAARSTSKPGGCGCGSKSNGMGGE